MSLTDLRFSANSWSSSTQCVCVSSGAGAASKSSSVTLSSCSIYAWEGGNAGGGLTQLGLLSEITEKRTKQTEHCISYQNTGADRRCLGSDQNALLREYLNFSMATPSRTLGQAPTVWDCAALEWFFYKLALGNILAGNNFLLWSVIPVAGDFLGVGFLFFWQFLKQYCEGQVLILIRFFFSFFLEILLFPFFSLIDFPLMRASLIILIPDRTVKPLLQSFLCHFVWHAVLT